MALQRTAVFQKVPEGYIGFIEELPGANTLGATLEEARETSKKRSPCSWMRTASRLRGGAAATR